MSNGVALAAGRLEQRGRRGLRLLADALLALGLVGYAGLTLATFLGRHHWLADQVTHFRPHLLAGAGILGLALVAAGRPRWLLPLALAAAAHAFVLVRPAPEPVAAGPGPALRVVVLNVLADNHRFADVLAYLREQRPDVLVLAEASGPWRKRLDQLEDVLPYSTLSLRGGHDTVVLSRMPMLEAAIFQPTGPRGGQISEPAVRVELEVGGERVVVWAVHPTSPMSAKQWRRRNAYHHWVAERVAAEEPGLPVIVAGDFNQTPWTPWHQAFLDRAGMLDAAATSWPEPTRRPFWPVTWRAVGIPIDRVTVRPGIGVAGFTVGPELGSDHFPLTVDLVLGRRG